MLFVNGVICGMSVLSLHADSIVRSPFVLSYTETPVQPVRGFSQAM